MKTASKKDSPENVRDRMPAAAEDLFARQGFEGTTLRAIAARARCDLAAVNYCDHGKEARYLKEALYLAVFLRRTHAARRRVKESLESWRREQGEAVTLETLVQEFADILLEPFLPDRGASRESGLLVRESEDPHVPVSLYGQSLMQPIVEAMTDALQSLYPRLSDRQAILCAESIIAELRGLLWTQRRCAGYRRHGTQVNAQERAKHFAVFCAAGIKQYLGQAGEQ